MIPVSKCRGVVYEIPVKECEHKYIGQTKRSLSIRLEENHSDTLPANILKKTEKNSFNETCNPGAQRGYMAPGVRSKFGALML